MPISQFVSSLLCVSIHYVARHVEYVDKRAGMFFLLLSQEILPYSWVGSCLYVFTSYEGQSIKRMDWFLTTIPVLSGALNMLYFWMRSEFASGIIWLVILVANILWFIAVIRAKKNYSRTKTKESKIKHLVNLGLASSSVLPAMVLIGSQSVSCLITDFAAGRPNHGALQYESNCDSVFNANKGMLLIFAYIVFQFSCFGMDRGLVMENLVRLQINRVQVLQVLCFGGCLTIAIFLYSCGGGFGQTVQVYRQVLLSMLCLVIITITGLQIIDALIAKIKFLHSRFRTVGGDDEGMDDDEEKRPSPHIEIRKWDEDWKKKGKASTASLRGDDAGEGIDGAVEVINPGFV